MGTPPLPWAAVSGVDSPLQEGILPDTQTDPPLAQLEGDSSSPAAFSLGEEAEPPSPSWQAGAELPAARIGHRQIHPSSRTLARTHFHLYSSGKHTLGLHVGISYVVTINALSASY